MSYWHPVWSLCSPCRVILLCWTSKHTFLLCRLVNMVNEHHNHFFSFVYFFKMLFLKLPPFTCKTARLVSVGVNVSMFLMYTCIDVYPDLTLLQPLLPGNAGLDSLNQNISSKVGRSVESLLWAWNKRPIYVLLVCRAAPLPREVSR